MERLLVLAALGPYKAMLDPGDLEELTNVIALFYTIPSVRFSWDRSPYAKALLEPEFVRFVEKIIGAELETSG